MNWAFGTEGNGMPLGTSMILWGPPKGGKSIVCNAIIGQLHKDDPEAYTISYNTELRGQFQTGEQQMKVWGIDPERHITFDVNSPELIFDKITTDIAALCEQGMKLKMIVIDSLTGIQGRRFMNATTIATQQIGDQAATLKDGLMMILPVIRKYKIALIMTSHVRAELNQQEQMRGKTIKMQAAWATKHTAEFFAFVERNQSKTGRVTLDGQEFTDETVVDFMDKAGKTGHKIRFRIDESSIGPQGRTAEFTLDYDHGLINTYEEVFVLGKNYGIIERPNNVTYKLKEQTFRGLAAMLAYLRDTPEACAEILKEVQKKDMDARK
jgi:hypothetical protein